MPHPRVGLPRFRVPPVATLSVMALLLAGCADGLGDFDFDFRPNSISNNGASLTAPRPEPDQNGLITYPSYQMVVARQGDTVGGVASRIGLTGAELASFNGRTATDVLRGGEILALPRMVGPSASGDITAIASAAIDRSEAGAGPSGLTVQQGSEPVRHRVARGETAYSVARLYDVPVRSLAEWNGLGPDLNVREGQQLIIPLSAASAGAAADGGRPGQSVLPPPPSAAEPLPDAVATTPLPDAPDLADNSEPAEPAAPAPQPAAADTELQRPVGGTVLRGFSAANEGVDISAAEGTAVVAAEAGEVAAITRDTEQIPILVIRHSGNLLTVYANIRNIQVERGDRVSRGQRVAEVGPGSPSFLHFEVRRGFEAVDPLPFIQ